MNTIINTASEFEDQTATIAAIDLGDATARQTLLQTVRETASSLYWGSAEESWEDANGQVFCEERMLVLLTYFLAAGEYSLDRMKETLRSEPALGCLARGLAINATTIRLFCAHNPELLRRCLARVLERVGGLPRRLLMATPEANHRIHRLLATVWAAEQSMAPTRVDSGSDTPARTEALNWRWGSRLRLRVFGLAPARFNAALWALLLAGSVAVAEDSQVGTSGVVVKDPDRRGLSGSVRHPPGVPGWPGSASVLPGA